jgi:hypothetical protein
MALVLAEVVSLQLNFGQLSFGLQFGT